MLVFLNFATELKLLLTFNNNILRNYYCAYKITQMKTHITSVASFIGFLSQKKLINKTFFIVKYETSILENISLTL